MIVESFDMLFSISTKTAHWKCGTCCGRTPTYQAPVILVLFRAPYCLKLMPWTSLDRTDFILSCFMYFLSVLAWDMWDANYNAEVSLQRDHLGVGGMLAQHLSALAFCVFIWCNCLGICFVTQFSFSIIYIVTIPLLYDNTVRSLMFAGIYVCFFETKPCSWVLIFGV